MNVERRKYVLVRDDGIEGKKGRDKRLTMRLRYVEPMIKLPDQLDAVYKYAREVFCLVSYYPGPCANTY